MRVRTRPVLRFVGVLFAVLLLHGTDSTSAQNPKPPAKYPAHLPYSFSNFVWWSDEELRALVKERVPSLGDEIATNPADEGKVRDALTRILKEKGIVAEVQSNEPSDFVLTAERAPGAPGPAIVFSILLPKILVDKVILSNVAEDVKASLSEDLARGEGHEYSGEQFWMVRSNTEEALQPKGYLEVKTTISHDSPRRDGDHYLVNLLVSVDAGPQYRISAITADGGPLLEGRDLSAYFSQEVGDVAGRGPFGQLSGQLRPLYWRYGYADVEIHAPPVLDRTHSQVSYHLEVIPGPVYHLRSLSIHNLDAASEEKVRALLGMKPGDVFDEMAINGLYHKLSAEPSLAARSFTFSPAKHIASASVDLTLDFYKVSDKSDVTVK